MSLTFLCGNAAGHSDPRSIKRYTHFSIAETKIPLQSLADRFDSLKMTGGA